MNDLDIGKGALRGMIKQLDCDLEEKSGIEVKWASSEEDLR